VIKVLLFAVDGTLDSVEVVPAVLSYAVLVDEDDEEPVFATGGESGVSARCRPLKFLFLRTEDMMDVMTSKGEPTSHKETGKRSKRRIKGSRRRSLRRASCASMTPLAAAGVL
jgi:hypothetical protein